MQAVFLAKGGRDAVRPVVAVAKLLQIRHPETVVSLITHRDHKMWVKEVLNESTIQTVWLQSSPTYDTTACGTCTDLTEDTTACCSCLRAYQSTPHAQRQSVRALILCNLAALDGVHLAEALSLPCIALSPGLVPYSLPANFIKQLQSTTPHLYTALQHCRPGKASLDEVQYWMWPLFDPRWSEWRQQTLGLPATLYQSAATFSTASEPSDIDQRSLDANTAAKQAAAHAQDMQGGPDAFVLPECVPLLLGIDQLGMTEASQPTASSVHTCGFWHLQDRTESEAGIQAELDNLMTLYPALKGTPFAQWQGNKGLVCLHMGSMAPSDLLPDCAVLSKLLTSALQKANVKGVLLTDGCMPFFFDMWMPAVGDTDPAFIADSSAFPPLKQLLHLCEAIVHLGSSSVIEAALAAGVPQVACPINPDQQALAKILCGLGVAVLGPGMHKDHLGTSTQSADTAALIATAADQLSNNLQVAFSGSMQEACHEAKSSLLEKEDGLNVAVHFIHQYLEKNGAVPELGNLRLPAVVGPVADDDQDLVKLPNGWEVAARAEMEGLFIYNEIFKDGCYMKHGIQIKDGDTVVDIGANVGMFVHWALQGDKEKGRGLPGRVFAVEPLQQNRKVMEHNLKRHDLLAKVWVIPKAVGAELGELQIRFYPNMPGNSTCHVQEKVDLQGEMMPELFFADAEDCVCPVTTVSQLMKDHAISHIDLLKVDVEGSELEVLQGVQPSDWANVQQVVMELHDVGDRLQAATDLLEAQGFSVQTERDFPPLNVMIYAQKSEKPVTA